MSNTVIELNDISKLYRLGEVGTGTLSHDLNRWWHRLRGQEDPYAKVGEENNRESKGGEYVWAIQDINFKVSQGEVLGVIGKNGAGKSTLLKILSRVTAPTKGTIKAKGRIASLLEVGTGFHPELTGRENIFLNGAILGMTKTEIRRKFDEIVAFSGVERYIDTPVKRYSSGMYVRLAFAVAAHLESEILIIDEVLAVGDAEFQKKCLGRMKDVSVQEGRTVLFVSHNMAAVRQLCTNAVVLKNGRLVFEGTQNEGVNFYQMSHNTNSEFIHSGDINEAPGNSMMRLLKVSVTPAVGDVVAVSSGVVVEIELFNNVVGKNFALNMEITNLDDMVILHHGVWVAKQNDARKGIYTISAEIPANTINAGIYQVSFFIAENVHNVLFRTDKIVQFEIMNEALGENNEILPGFLKPIIDYKINHTQ